MFAKLYKHINWDIVVVMLIWVFLCCIGIIKPSTEAGLLTAVFLLMILFISINKRKKPSF